MNHKIKSILLIDDNEHDNLFHKIMITEAGVTETVQVAENGIDALQWLHEQEQSPELIFLDINMPRMNGWEFLEKFADWAREREVKPVVIVLTTSLNPADQKRAEKANVVSGFESKPLTVESIQSVAEKFLGLTR